MGTVNVVNVAKRHQFTWYEKFYFWSIGKGLWITLKHFVKVAFFNKQVTIEYPDKKRMYSTRFRGMHSMKRDELGSGTLHRLFLLYVDLSCQRDSY